jgi:[acyl-carrier-protein] S-malonyltransferase
MSSNSRKAFLFPGQGGYLPTALRQVAEAYPEVGEVIAEIDAAVPDFGRARADQILRSGLPRSLSELLADDPHALQLAIFGISVSMFSILGQHAGSSDVLIGHSLGEIAALTSAGVLTVADGARIVQARTAALQRVPGGGGMLAVSANAEVAMGLALASDDPMVAVAARNAPRQTVLSGPLDSLDRIRAAAAALGVSCTPVPAAYAYHSPMLAVAVEPFAASIAAVAQHPLQRRVYSPILGRFYCDSDPIGQLLASHLLRQVGFVDAVRTVHAGGVGWFVECGAKNALTKLASRCVPEISTLSCLDGSGNTALIDLALDQLSSSVATTQVRSNGRSAQHNSASQQHNGLSAAPVSTVSGDGASSQSVPNGAEIGFTVSAGLRTDDRPATAAAAAKIPVLEPAAPSPHVLPPTLLTQQPATPAESAGSVTARPDRTQLLAELRTTYAIALDYPESVFSDDAELEADLGVDSVKQTELLARVSDRYELSVLSDDFRLSELTTLASIADLILNTAGSSVDRKTRL